jgi:ATP-dependent protease ClpP protease subunit
MDAKGAVEYGLVDKVMEIPENKLPKGIADDGKEK